MKLDGLRGPFGHGYIQPSVFYTLAQAMVGVLGIDCFVIGHDGRPSSPELHSALIDGAISFGAKVYDVGVMPTPMLAKWAMQQNICGLMVTASHNPVSDNGLKMIWNDLSISPAQAQAVKDFMQRTHALRARGVRQYMATGVKASYIKALGVRQLPNWKCYIDTAHGAWSPHIDVLQEVGVNIQSIHQSWTPGLINTTGSLHARDTRNSMLNEPYDYIVCVDGDGDRLQLIYDDMVLDGDDILHHIALHDKRPVVGTVMSNQALETSMSRQNIPYHTVSVGDQHVRKKLQEVSGIWGAEPCGHVICLDWLPTSDPIYTFLHLAEAEHIFALPNKIYQKHFELPLSTDIEALRQQLKHPNIRSVIRPSQTQSLVRVMLEGEELLIDTLLERI